MLRSTTVATALTALHDDDADHDEDRHNHVGDVDHVCATTDALATTETETMAEGSPRRTGRTDDKV